MYFFNQKLLLNPNISLKDIVNIINRIKNEIKGGLMNSLLDNINEYDNRYDLLVKYNNIIYQFTTSYNQNNKIHNNISSIDLLECENILKEKYKINQNKSLTTFMISYFIQELNIPIIRFEIFDPISKEQLNINFCENTYFKIYTPVTFNEENLYKYNPNNDYYNDICFPYTTDKGTDKVLVDRKKEYNMNYMSLCEVNCYFREYNTKTKKVLCECNINNRTFLNLEDIINKEKLLDNFNIKSSSNLLVMKCYNLLFTKEIFFKNIGNYILLSIIIIHNIATILFYIKEYPLIYLKIINIIESKRNKKENEENQNKEIILRDNIKQNPNLEDIQNNENSSNSSVLNKIKKNNTDQIHVDTINYIDCEINSFSYKEAAEKDKREIFENYISLIKTKHLLIFNFYQNAVHTPKIIKMSLTLFIFALYYAINTLFFNDSTMHKLYEDEGIFNFIYLLPKIIYSTIISSIITVIIKKLALLDNIIYELRKINDINKCNTKIKIIKIKFLGFFVLGFKFLIFFWYYVSCFVQ